MLNHFKIAWRGLVKHRKTSFINIGGLAIGMAAAVLIMLWVQNELSFDAFQKDAGNIYRIKTNLQITKTETWVWETSPHLLGEFAQKQIPSVKGVTRLQAGYKIIFNNNGQLINEKKFAYVDDHWFDIFHYDFVDGSAESFNKNAFSLVLTQSAAKRYFGKHDAVGKMLRVDSVTYQVQGVVKDNPANSSLQFEVLIPITAKYINADEKKNSLSWNNFNDLTFLKLAPGANTAKVSAQLKKICARNRKDDSQNSYSLVALKDIHFENDLQRSSFIHGNSKVVGIFSILAVLLLATACINYVNLTTARASSRSKEVSVRKIVGAGRWHLFAQFMSESFLVSMIALLLAIVLIQLSMPGFNSITEKNFALPATSLTAWSILIGTLFVCFLVNGIYPALLLSSFQPLNVFKGKNALSINDAGFRKILVVVQFTISVVLIIGTIVIYRQLNYLENKDLGYSRAHVFSMSIPWNVLGFDDKKRAAILSSVKNELRQQGSISDVSTASVQSFFDNDNLSSGNFDWEGRPKDFEPSFATLSADDHFQQMMHLKMKEGHWFNADGSDRHNVILNETAIKQMNMRLPVIGQRFKFKGDSGFVVGVVKDFNFQSLHEKIAPMIINNDVDWSGSFYMKTAPNSTKAAIGAAQNVWKKFVANEPFEYSFLDDGYDKLYRAEQRSSLLVTIFSVIAVLLSGMGLLGLVTFAAEQRIKEIGIRKILGASIQSIIKLLSADLLKMVLIASILAFPIAWWAMDKWLQDFAYRIDISWWIFLSAAGVALLVALITISIQAIKAAIANPVNSLRSE